MALKLHNSIPKDPYTKQPWDHEYQFIRIRMFENHTTACEMEIRECAQVEHLSKVWKQLVSFCLQDQMMKILLLLQKLQDEKEDWDMGMQNHEDEDRRSVLTHFRRFLKSELQGLKFSRV